MKEWARRTIGATVALALVGGLASSQGLAAVAKPSTAKTQAAAALATASSVSAKVTKTDKIKTPKLRWYTCYGDAKCATAKVPRDYDKPKGAKTELAILKRSATQPKNKIGTLFVNPGGPGGSATELAYFSDFVFSKSVLARFDIVGVDPRGIAFSSNAKCFSSVRTQTKALSKYPDAWFPTNAKQAEAWYKGDKALGKACSKKKGLITAMSTAQVARDMELIRRAVGDKKLSYFGFSYGSYLGQVYANMYPKRFRAIAIDGVLDPNRWAGTTKKLRAEPIGSRLRSGEGGWKALREILVRCRQVGTARCEFAGGDPVAKFARLAKRIKSKPLVIREDGETYTFTYDILIGSLRSYLYDADAWNYIMYILDDLYTKAYPPASARLTKAEQQKRNDRLVRLYKLAQQLQRPGYDFPYNNAAEASSAVVCTDSRESTKLKKFASTYIKKADGRDPYFSRSWMWAWSICAGDTFTGKDEDAYKGPFDRKTAAPVLVVGNYWDPATNYLGAQAAARLLPNSRLLSSNSWGHTAYGTSKCATTAIDSYLLSGKVPRAYATCRGDSQPFQTSEEEVRRSHERAKLMARVMGGLR